MDRSRIETTRRDMAVGRNPARWLTCATVLMLSGCTFTASTGSSQGAYHNPPPTHGAERPPDRVTRYYSPPLYQSFVSRSVPYQAIADSSSRAAVDSLLRVREADTIGDDYYTRKGKIVMLGMEGGALVGFTTRYSVDIRYPDDDLIRDGVGKPDFRESVLTLSVQRARCTRRGRRFRQLVACRPQLRGRRAQRPQSIAPASLPVTATRAGSCRRPQE